jgi:hypothetical protein
VKPLHEQRLVQFSILELQAEVGYLSSLAGQLLCFSISQHVKYISSGSA